jgi:xanthine dehydrogenase accessory factor
MLFLEDLVVVRGGGDIGTGVVARLHRAGFPVVVLEVDPPLTVRRTVAVSSAVTAGSVDVEDLVAERVGSAADAVGAARSGTVAVLVDAGLPPFPGGTEAVVDARLAKRNIDSARNQAPLVIGLGPGFTAGVDCHAVVETMRGHGLGRVIWEGAAATNTGVPGRIGGEDELRVLRAENAGRVSWDVGFGDHVMRDQAMGLVGETTVRALTHGVVRGLIAPGFPATPGLKIGDIDPRANPDACWEISDKALSVGGGVLEAVLVHLNRSS